MFIYQFVASNNGQLKSMVFENKKLIPFEAIGENKECIMDKKEIKQLSDMKVQKPMICYQSRW